ncbi:MAG: cation diffusion facilitator family transporter [Actinobacteria bacterium]|nr:cation diffusion facilitator family transporter [Actinomycetota bacterium]
MDGDLKAVVAALAANVGIAIAKFVGFVATGSASMLAETLHSVADTTDQGLLLFGRWRARRGETPEHPFGHSGERYFWAFVVSILIFTLGALVAGREGIEALRNQAPLRHTGWAIGILLVALMLDSFSLRTAVREANRDRDSSWWQHIRETKRAEVTVILLEDSAAVTGVLAALVGVGLTALTGDPMFDALGSLVIAVLLATMAGILAVEMKSLLMGEAASEAQRERIRDILNQDDEIRDVVYLRTMHLGPEDLLIETKVEMDPGLTAREVALTIDRIEDRIRQAVPPARVISIEPDVPRDEDPDRPDFVADSHDEDG